MCTPETAQKIITNTLQERKVLTDEVDLSKLVEQLIYDARLAQAEEEETLVCLAIPIINMHLVGIIT